MRYFLPVIRKQACLWGYVTLRGLCFIANFFASLGVLFSYSRLFGAWFSSFSGHTNTSQVQTADLQGLWRKHEETWRQRLLNGAGSRIHDQVISNNVQIHTKKTCPLQSQRSRAPINLLKHHGASLHYIRASFLHTSCSVTSLLSTHTENCLKHRIARVWEKMRETKILKILTKRK